MKYSIFRFCQPEIWNHPLVGGIAQVEDHCFRPLYPEIGGKIQREVLLTIFVQKWISIPLFPSLACMGGHGGENRTITQRATRCRIFATQWYIFFILHWLDPCTKLKGAT